MAIVYPLTLPLLQERMIAVNTSSFNLVHNIITAGRGDSFFDTVAGPQPPQWRGAWSFSLLARPYQRIMDAWLSNAQSGGGTFWGIDTQYCRATSTASIEAIPDLYHINLENLAPSYVLAAGQTIELSNTNYHRLVLVTDSVTASSAGKAMVSISGPLPFGMFAGGDTAIINGGRAKMKIVPGSISRSRESGLASYTFSGFEVSR